MSKPQFLAILGALVLFCALFFGLANKPGENVELVSSEASKDAEVMIYTLLANAKQELEPTEADFLKLLEEDIELDKPDSIRVSTFKRLSSFWFEKKHPEVAGYYAEKVAELVGDGTSWSIAGTTYGYALETEPNGDLKDYRRDRGVQAFEKVISLQPDAVEGRLNMALLYVAQPLQENPMKGITMLLGLQEQFPQSVEVLYHLGRLALATGQFDKAEGRLKAAEKIEPGNLKVACLLYNLYSKMGRPEAVDYKNSCGTQG